MAVISVQGTGPSSSAVTEISRYETEHDCRADGELLRKKFYVDYLCLRIREKK